MLTAQQIRAHVEALSEKCPDATAFALKVTSKWGGPDSMVIRGRQHRIIASESELALREAIIEAEKHQAPVVLLTGCEDGELGEDLRARLARRRVLPLSSSEMFRHLFKAKDIEPRLRNQLWLAELLVEAAPPDGYTPVPGGRLDEDTAIEAFLRRVMAFPTGRPDLVQVLEWSRGPQNVTRLKSLDPVAMARFETWIGRTAGPAVSLVLSVMQSNQPTSLVALGLISGIVFRKDVPTVLATAQGRLEQFFGGRMPSPAEAVQLAAAAATVVEQQGVEQSRHDLEVLDQLFQQLRIESFAVESDHSPTGCEKRFEALAQVLELGLQKLDRGSLEAIDAAFKSLENHRLVATQAERRLRALMAVRLCRWLALSPTEANADFGKLVNEYVHQGSYVDWARHSLYHGDSCQGLARSYGEIVRRVGLRREVENRGFGKALTEATQINSLQGLAGVEDVIPWTVVPLLAQKERVLFIVADGLSFPVFRELLPSVQQSGLVCLTPRSGNQPNVAVAGVPSVTEWTRRLLLGGRDGAVGSLSEKAIFSAHPSLGGQRSNGTPVLFLKGDITQAGDVGFSHQVRTALESETPLVGVVINAVDDHLLKGDQISVPWTVERIPLLQQLLNMAGFTDRVVVITADHGHMLETDSVPSKGDGRDRYRTNDAPPAETEFEVRGRRVAPLNNGRCIALWSERTIYTQRKNGYHGGLSPQEMLVPVVVLARDLSIPPQWEPAKEPLPDWWTGTPTKSPVGPQASLRPSARQPQPDLPFFQASAQVSGTAPWITQLLCSPLFERQRSKAGRVAPTAEIIGQTLKALDERGGAMLVDVLAGRIGLPVFRMGGFLSGLQRVLNLEGYQVLSVDKASETVRLNPELLKTQFDLNNA
jgi:hypothetical protein